MASDKWQRAWERGGVAEYRLRTSDRRERQLA